MRAASPASTRVSPRLTRSCLPLTVRVHLSPMINRLSQIEGRRRRTAGSVHDDPHRSHVAGMGGGGGGGGPRPPQKGHCPGRKGGGSASRGGGGRPPPGGAGGPP